MKACTAACAVTIAGLATVCSCVSAGPQYGYNDGYYRYEAYNPGVRQTSGELTPVAELSTTELVSMATDDYNEYLFLGGVLPEDMQTMLDYGKNSLLPDSFDIASAGVRVEQPGEFPELWLESPPDGVAWAVFNFNPLPNDKAIRVIELYGEGSFPSLEDGGFYLGLRQGSNRSFAWSGPVDHEHNWIFSFTFKQDAQYWGGSPSIAIAVGHGDFLKLRQIRIVVDDVDDLIVRDSSYRAIPPPGYEYYNNRAGHYCNNRYCDGRDYYHDCYYRSYQRRSWNHRDRHHDWRDHARHYDWRDHGQNNPRHDWDNGYIPERKQAPRPDNDVVSPVADPVIEVQPELPPYILTPAVDPEVQPVVKGVPVL